MASYENVNALVLQVCPKLKKHVSHLLSNPSVMMKSWAKYVAATTHPDLLMDISCLSSADSLV